MRSIRVSLVLTFAGALVFGLLGPVPTALGATISPTVFSDDVTNNNNCTLREAVIAANGDVATDQCPAGAGADTITLAAGTYTLSIAPDGTPNDALDGDVDITEDLTVAGSGAAQTVVDGGGVDRLFHVDPGETLDAVSAAFTGLTIRNGEIATNDGGGILAEDALTVTDAIITGNTAENAGGIDSDGDDVPITLTRAAVLANESLLDAGGVDADGPATVTGSSFVGNTAQNDAGGIDLSGTATITGSTFSGNRALGTDDIPPEGRGGGLEVRSDTTLTLTNSTVSGNQATADGAGLRIATGGGNIATLNNVTITGNTADSDNSGAPGDGGGISNPEGLLLVKNSIVAGNLDPSGGGIDCGGSVVSQGQVLLGSSAGCGYTAGSGDIVGQDAKVGPLGDNGGVTPTHALKKGSPAINAGGGDCAAADQRGLPRADCDIGAYELVLCRKVPVNRIGTQGKDSLKGTAGADGLLGFGKNDKLSGKGGKDGLCGGPGKDTLKGGEAKDRLDGGPGKDTCVGQAGRDKARACEREKSIP